MIKTWRTCLEIKEEKPWSRRNCWIRPRAQSWHGWRQKDSCVGKEKGWVVRTTSYGNRRRMRSWAKLAGFQMACQPRTSSSWTSTAKIKTQEAVVRETSLLTTIHSTEGELLRPQAVKEHLVAYQWPLGAMFRPEGNLHILLTTCSRWWRSNREPANQPRGPTCQAKARSQLPRAAARSRAQTWQNIGGTKARSKEDTSSIHPDQQQRSIHCSKAVQILQRSDIPRLESSLSTIKKIWTPQTIAAVVEMDMPRWPRHPSIRAEQLKLWLTNPITRDFRVDWASHPSAATAIEETRGSPKLEAQGTTVSSVSSMQLGPLLTNWARATSSTPNSCSGIFHQVASAKQISLRSTAASTLAWATDSSQAEEETEAPLLPKPLAQQPLKPDSERPTHTLKQKQITTSSRCVKTHLPPAFPQEIKLLKFK